MKPISIAAFADKYDIEKVTVSVAINNITKRTGKPPAWYIGNGVIDEEHIIKADKRRRDKYTIATSPDGIYYRLMEYFESDSSLARVLSTVTSRSQKTWIQFLSYRLFHIPGDKVSVAPRANNMMDEFIRIGSSILIQKAAE